MTSHQHPDHLTLITGGTGKTGRRIADRLTACGRPVRIGSRSETPAFDWDDSGTWSAVESRAEAAQSIESMSSPGR